MAATVCGQSHGSRRAGSVELGIVGSTGDLPLESSAAHLAGSRPRPRSHREELSAMDPLDRVDARLGRLRTPRPGRGASTRRAARLASSVTRRLQRVRAGVGRPGADGERYSETARPGTNGSASSRRELRARELVAGAGAIQFPLAATHPPPRRTGRAAVASACPELAEGSGEVRRFAHLNARPRGRCAARWLRAYSSERRVRSGEGCGLRSRNHCAGAE